MSNCRHLLTTWPYLPHDKHNTAAQSLRAVADVVAVSAFLGAGISTSLLYQWVQIEAAVPVPARPETGVSASLSIFCIECFTTTFLHTHSWLNWVDEDEVGLKEKMHQNDYFEIRPEAPGVWAKDLINLIPIYCHHWDCGLRKSAGASSLRTGGGGGEIS